MPIKINPIPSHCFSLTVSMFPARILSKINVTSIVNEFAVIDENCYGYIPNKYA